MAASLRLTLWGRFCLGAVALAAAISTFGLPAAAQDLAAPVLAIIDVQKVLRESVAVKALTATIEEQRDKYQQELKQQEETLRGADKELTKQRTILSAEAYTAKRRELEQQVGTLQRQVQERKKGLDQLFSQGMSQVQNELANVAKEIAEERGIDLILSRATVVIVKPKFDISNEALTRLNARLQSVAIQTPQN